MRGLMVLVALLLFAGGVAAQAGVFGPADSSEANDEALLTRLKTRLWNPRAELEVLSIEENRTKMGGYGNRVEADPGYVFLEVRVLVHNTGNVRLPVSTWHFSAENEQGRNVRVELSMPRHDFDGSAIPPHAVREGLLIFEVPEGTQLSAILWQGEITWARTVVSA